MVNEIDLGFAFPIAEVTEIENKLNIHKFKYKKDTTITTGTISVSCGGVKSIKDIYLLEQIKVNHYNYFILI